MVILCDFGSLFIWSFSWEPLSEAKSWPFARFQLGDVRRGCGLRGLASCRCKGNVGSVVAPGLWNHLVESFKDLEIWTGKESLQNMTDAEAIASNSPPSRHVDIQMVIFSKVSLRMLILLLKAPYQSTDIY